MLSRIKFLILACHFSINVQNCRIWTDEQPEETLELSLHPQKYTVWCGLKAGGIIGSYFFKNKAGQNVTVNGDRYRTMTLNDFLLPEIETRDIGDIWFQQHGTTAHTSRETIALLRNHFEFFLWGYVKSKVFVNKPATTIRDLEINITRIIRDIPVAMLENIIRNSTFRMDHLRRIRVQHLNEIAFKKQAQLDKCIVVHLAKNREEDIDVESPEEESVAGSTHGIQRIEDIDTQTLANQWFCASKMIPGSFTVLGVFVSAVEESILDERTFKAAKQLLYDINNILQGRTFSGSTEEYIDGSYVFLAHSTNAKQTVCKSYTHSSKECKKTYFTANIKCVLCGGSFTSMECRFVEKLFKWITIDCNFELDEVFPVIDNTPKINIEKQFQKTIEIVRQNLQASEIFIQNDSVDDTLTLDAYIKQKNHLKIGNQQQIDDCLWATIFVPIKCQSFSEPQTFTVRQCSDTIRFSGIISSRIYCNPRNTLSDVKRFLREDVMRSLAARIQVYCDGLTAPNIQNEAIFISEPPRRVYFNLPNCSTVNPIQFSDYLFRGEAATVACSQAKQILDLFIESENIIDDMEGLPDVDSFREIVTPQNNQPSAGKPHAHARTLYVLGIAVTLLVLLISVLLKMYLDA